MAAEPFVGAAFPLAVCTCPHIASPMHMNHGGCMHMAAAHVCNMTWQWLCIILYSRSTLNV